MAKGMTKYFIPAGTKVRACQKTGRASIRWRSRVVERDVTYTDDDRVKLGSHWSFELPKEAMPYTSIMLKKTLVEVRDL